MEVFLIARKKIDRQIIDDYESAMITECRNMGFSEEEIVKIKAMRSKSATDYNNAIKDNIKKALLVEDENGLTASETIAYKVVQNVKEFTTPKNVETLTKITGDMSNEVNLKVSGIESILAKITSDEEEGF